MSHKWWIAIIVVPVAVGIDQLTKFLVRSQIALSGEVEVFPRFFHIIHVENSGAAWGMLGDFEHRMTVFMAVSVVAFVVIGLYFRWLRPGDRWAAVALSLTFAGAMGNFLDRVIYRQVTDFLDFHAGWDGALREFVLAHSATAHYPTFNVADMAITGGVVMFLIHVLILEPRSLARAGANDGRSDESAASS